MLLAPGNRESLSDRHVLMSLAGRAGSAERLTQRSADRQIDRQRNARPGPRTTVKVVSHSRLCSTHLWVGVDACHASRVSLTITMHKSRKAAYRVQTRTIYVLYVQHSQQSTRKPGSCALVAGELKCFTTPYGR